MENSKIGWTDHTFNAWIGCSKVSEGCDHCYAEETMDHVYRKVEWGPGKARKRTSPSYWKQPLTWDRRAAREGVRERVFCCSLADVFDHEAPTEWRQDLFRLIEKTPNLDWLLLTKRPKNIPVMLAEIADAEGRSYHCKMPMPNVWLGVSAENEFWLRNRLEFAWIVPAVCYFVSGEPLLGPLHVGRVLQELLPQNPGRRLDWLILGGESGRQARELELPWVGAALAEARPLGVRVFVKQLGSKPVGLEIPPSSSDAMRRVPLKLAHKKGEDMQEWPPHLCVQEYPEPHPIERAFRQAGGMAWFGTPGAITPTLSE